MATRATSMPPPASLRPKLADQAGTCRHVRDWCCRFFGTIFRNWSRTAGSGILLACFDRHATVAIHRRRGCGEPVGRNDRPTLCPRVHVGGTRRRFAWTRPPSRRPRHGAHRRANRSRTAQRHLDTRPRLRAGRDGSPDRAARVRAAPGWYRRAAPGRARAQAGRGRRNSGHTRDSRALTLRDHAQADRSD